MAEFRSRRNSCAAGGTRATEAAWFDIIEGHTAAPPSWSAAESGELQQSCAAHQVNKAACPNTERPRCETRSIASLLPPRISSYADCVWNGTFTKSYLEALAPLEAWAPAESLACWLRASCELEAPTASMCLMSKLPAQVRLHADPARQRSAAPNPGQGRSGAGRTDSWHLQSHAPGQVAPVRLATRTTQAQHYILCWSGLEPRQTHRLQNRLI